MPTASKEDYLKAILMLEDCWSGPSAVAEPGPSPVTTNALSERLQMKPGSVTGMIRNLADDGWVTYEAYRGVNLTEQGRRIATEVVRKHRLWEVFLVEKLGFGWEEVHDLAEQLEHIEDMRLAERLAAFLDHPRFDPHGDLIPSASGAMVDERKLVRLSELPKSSRACIKGVVDSGDVFLAHLNELGIHLGMHLELINHFAFDGSVSIHLESSESTSQDAQHVWSREVADNLWVERLQPLNTLHNEHGENAENLKRNAQ